MNEHREHDDGSVTHFVRQFRRVARRAAADPLRLLPLDPLIELASLSAPIAALIGIAPFERLREAAVSMAPDARAGVTRTRLQPWVRNPGTPRSKATSALAGRSPRTARLRDGGTINAGHVAPVSHVSDARSREERARKAAPPIATLAERRAALRRSLSDNVTLSPSSQSVFVQPSTASGSRGNPWRPRSAADASGAGARVTESTPPLRRNLPGALPAELLGTRREDRPLGANALSSVLAGTPSVAAWSPATDDDPAGVGDVIAPARAAGFHADAMHHQQPASVPGAHTGPSAAAGPLPHAGRAESRVEAEAVRRRRSSESMAGPEGADDLFEALYRGGVDVSWP